jgi:hypothetical protein
MSSCQTGIIPLWSTSGERMKGLDVEVKMLSFEHLMYSDGRTVLQYARSFPPRYERKRIRQANDKGAS